MIRASMLTAASGLFGLLALLPTVTSQAPSTSRHRPWTIADIIGQERTSDWQLDHDGRRALWLRHRPDEKQDRSQAVLMLSTLGDNPEHLELTIGDFDLSSPSFSPDGRRIAFLSSAAFPKGVENLPEEDRGAQVWLLDLRGGAPRPVTKIAHGVTAFAWRGDDGMVLLARERLAKREREVRANKDDSNAVEDRLVYAEGATRLFHFDPGQQELHRLSDNELPIERFWLAADGRHAIALHGRSPSQRALGDAPPRTFLHDFETMSAVEVFPGRKTAIFGAHWSRDSRRVYLESPRASVDGEDWASVVEVDELALTDGGFELHRVDLGTDRGLDADVQGHFVVTDDGFVAGLANGVRPVFARFTRGADGAHRRAQLRGGDALGQPLHDLLGCRDRDVVLAVSGDASTPDHVYQGRLDDDALAGAQPLYRPNAGFESLHHARTETLRYPGAGGDEVEAILYHPHDRAADERRPLVLITHGGPHAHDVDRFTERWANSPNLYTARGAFVLKVNYHGSSGYGLAFGESIKGRYYELELIDLFAGIQKLVDDGLVDRDRLGLVGWSNGAILSIAALTHGGELAPDYDFTFRACAPGAGDVNWTSDYGNCEFGPSFDDYYVGGTPWDDEQAYLAKSPLFRMESVTTPTIVFFGSQDRAVPTEQGWQHFRAMQRIGKAPVRFILFPGAGHGLTKLSHQRRKLEEELRWLDEHLFDVAPAATPLADPAAPLAVAELLADLPRQDGCLGRQEAGALVPEVVPVRLDGVLRHVGRFEVTRAQWASFRAAATPSVRPNAPATGISMQDAEAYVAWLTERTGSTWRLLTTAEFDALPKGTDENTLDHQAGFAPRPEEAAALAARVARLGPLAVLRDAGQSPPGSHGDGDDRQLLFDVGGNAAEWVQGAAGPVLRGGCAVIASDDRRDPAAGLDVPPAFAGLRVARER